MNQTSSKRTRDAQRSDKKRFSRAHPGRDHGGNGASLNAAQGTGPRPLGSWTQRQVQPLSQPSTSPVPPLPCQVTVSTAPHSVTPTHA